MLADLPGSSVAAPFHPRNVLTLGHRLESNLERRERGLRSRSLGSLHSAFGTLVGVCVARTLLTCFDRKEQ